MLATGPKSTLVHNHVYVVLGVGKDGAGETVVKLFNPQEATVTDWKQSDLSKSINEIITGDAL
jgi:hypothetical protein